MKRLLHILDTHLQRGTAVSITIGGVAVLILIAYIVIGRTNIYPTFLFVLLGFVLTWREYVVWRRRKAQGVELIGSSREIED